MTQTLPTRSLALCLLLSLTVAASANDMVQVERERAALRREFFAAKDAKTKRKVLAKLKKLSGARSLGAKERKALRQSIESRYQVKLDSDGAVAVGHFYSDAPRSIKNQVRSKPWTARELELIGESLALLAPLLTPGDNLDRIARVNSSISRKKPGYTVGATDRTMGQWFNRARTLVLTDRASTPIIFSTPDREFKGTLIHELAHGLLGSYDPRTGKRYANQGDNPVMQEWRKAAGWQEDGRGRIGGQEAPPTRYARKSANEDLSESTMRYLLDNASFKAGSPKRAAFLDALFADAKAYKASRTSGPRRR